MGKHHPELHCRLFTIEPVALPQAMLQTMCTWLSQLVGGYTCLGKQQPPAQDAAGSHTTLLLLSCTQSRERCPPTSCIPGQQGLWFSQPRGTSSLHGQMLHGQGNAARRMKGGSWPCAAALQLFFALHRKGFLTGLNFRAQLRMLQKCLVSSAGWLPGHKHSQMQTLNHLGCCAGELLLIPQKSLLS